MADLPITFSDAGFPANFAGDVQSEVAAFIANLAATISTTSIILGQVGGSEPGTNVGPWLNGQQWEAWNGTVYAPVITKLGNATNQITLGTATLTANRTINFRDQSGTVALTSDVFVPRATIILSGTGTVLMNFGLSNSFYISLTGDTQLGVAGSQPGQKVNVAVHNTTHALTWGPFIMWPGGSPPAQTNNATDVYVVENVAGTLYGYQVGANFS